MAVILNLETATTNCSVCVAQGDEVLAFREDRSPGYSHAEQLHVFIKSVMAEASLKMSDLQAVAVSKGPGSYTGLRIGVSAAKGLAYALGIPLISVPTLESLAGQLQINDGVIIPLIDARRMEVYSSVYDESYKLLRETRAEIIDKHSFEDYHGRDIHLLGNAVDKCRELLTHPDFVFHKDHLPSAREMAGISARKYTEKAYEDTAYFEPYYLKDFIGIKKSGAL